MKAVRYHGPGQPFRLEEVDWREQLPRTPVPVLLCYGARSALYSTELGALLDEQIPQSELVVFEESGQSPFWEEPEKFNREIARFAG
jgi:non-heme chloroperoxidase